MTCLSFKTHISFRGVSCQCTLSKVVGAGIVSPLGRVAAAASSFNFQPDLSAASAAKATEYMKDSAAASVAAFLLDGQTDVLPAPAAQAFHFMECQRIKQTLRAAAAGSRDFGGESFCCHCSSHVRVVLVGRWILDWLQSPLEQMSSKKTCLHFRQGEETRMHIKKEPRILWFFRPPGFLAVMLLMFMMPLTSSCTVIPLFAPLLDMRRRFKAVMDVFGSMISHTVTLARSVELTAQWIRSCLLDLFTP